MECGSAVRSRADELSVAYYRSREDFPGHRFSCELESQREAIRPLDHSSVSNLHSQRINRCSPKLHGRSSTLENWVREFQRFAPEIDVQTYYGSQKEREELRYQLKEQHRAGELEVLLTTYDLAYRADDQKFLRKKLEFEASRLVRRLLPCTTRI